MAAWLIHFQRDPILANQPTSSPSQAEASHEGARRGEGEGLWMGIEWGPLMTMIIIMWSVVIISGWLYLRWRVLPVLGMIYRCRYVCSTCLANHPKPTTPHHRLCRVVFAAAVSVVGYTAWLLLITDRRATRFDLSNKMDKCLTNLDDVDLMRQEFSHYCTGDYLNDTGEPS